MPARGTGDKNIVEQKLFSLYRDMGPGRSLKRLAKLTGYSYEYILKLSTQFKWKKRLEQYPDAEIVYSPDVKDLPVANIKVLLSTLNISLMDYLRRVRENPDEAVKIKNMVDLERLIKLSTQLMTVLGLEEAEEIDYDLSRELLEIIGKKKRGKK